MRQNIEYVQSPAPASQSLLPAPGSSRQRKVDLAQELPSKKIPKLLDTVHQVIENTNLRFALSGSSARKLKRGAANLLAGRAFELRMHPLTSTEVGARFDLRGALEWGTLPKIFSFKKETAGKKDFLEAYAHLYVREEIQEEQIVRKLDPFRDFLEVAAQFDARIINFSKIADDVGVDTVTVISYFGILEETFLGTRLPAYHASVRKRQRRNPKFYFFDPGVRRALDGTLGDPTAPGRSEFGRLFEGFVINEIIRRGSYAKRGYTYSYLNADDDAEIDLIIEKGRRPLFLVEIKSSDRVDLTDARTLVNFRRDFPGTRLLCISRDADIRTEDGIEFVDLKSALSTIADLRQ